MGGGGGGRGEGRGGGGGDGIDRVWKAREAQWAGERVWGIK